MVPALVEGVEGGRLYNCRGQMEREIHTGYACVSYTLVSYHHHHVCTRGEGRDWVSRCGCACTCVCEGERKMRSRCSRQVSAGSRLESRANYPLLRFPSHSLLSSKFLLFDRLLAYLPTYLPSYPPTCSSSSSFPSSSSSSSSSSFSSSTTLRLCLS